MVNYLWTNLFKKEGQEENQLTVLKKNILFQTLSRKDLRFVHSILHERSFRAGEVIFQQGNLGTGMYLIIKGSVDIIIRDTDSSKQISNQDLQVAHLVSEDFFGEISLVEENSKRSATAIAAEDTLLVGLFKPDLMELLERNPTTGAKVILQLAKVLGRRLRETTNKIEHLKKELKILVEIQKKKEA